MLICDDSKMNSLFVYIFIYFLIWFQVSQAGLKISVYVTEDDLELVILLPLPYEY